MKRRWKKEMEKGDGKMIKDEVKNEIKKVKPKTK
jgi:hypothetical protein